MGDETAIRAVLSPYHFKDNKKFTKLSKQAFKAPSSVDEVSVSRGPHVPCWIAKAYAKFRVQRPLDSTPKLYRGLAFIPVETIREVGVDIIDSRSEYLGHADIKYGVVQDKAVALPPEVRFRLDQQAQALADSATFVRDPDPESWKWSGN